MLRNFVLEKCVRGRLMTLAEKYKDQAAVCVRFARETDDVSDRALLVAMAEAWVKLAEQAEIRESQPPKSEPSSKN